MKPAFDAPSLSPAGKLFGVFLAICLHMLLYYVLHDMLFRRHEIGKHNPVEVRLTVEHKIEKPIPDPLEALSIDLVPEIVLQQPEPPTVEMPELPQEIQPVASKADTGEVYHVIPAKVFVLPEALLPEPNQYPYISSLAECLPKPEGKVGGGVSPGPTLIKIKFLIGAKGELLGETLLASSGSAALDKTFLDALGHCAFVPAKLDGGNVKAVFTMEFDPAAGKAHT